ncbi:protein YIPF3 [Rhipicephalus microplus]|uniref:protein YIPF3 n=1 Tax=Rhipicephalus microplus TaxID=6941 RepID=UPI0018880FBE|nr:protein YIPF3-like isoform X1 [Rhipicephalus microplus]
MAAPTDARAPLVAPEKQDSTVLDFTDVASPDFHNEKFYSAEKPAPTQPSQDVFSAMPSMLLWQAGKQQAQNAFSIYANIDLLRPYFHVEPQEVRARILESFLPRWPSHYAPLLIPAELYGPLMLVLTLITLLLFGMKTSGHTVKEGTLMGTAFGVSFGYWLGGSALVRAAGYISSTQLSFFQVLSLMGYGLSGHCLALLLGNTFHPAHSHLFFYVVWLLLGGSTAVKLISVFSAKTASASHKTVAAGTAGALHLLALLYFHFAYHRTVEVLENI